MRIDPPPIEPGEQKAAQEIKRTHAARGRILRRHIDASLFYDTWHKPTPELRS